MKLGNKLILVLFGLILGLTIASKGYAVPFDPDGTGPAGAINLGTFDWGPTSFAAIGGGTAFTNFNTNPACPGTTCNFDVVVHAKLIGTLDPNGIINTPASIAANTTEITMVSRFTEKVTGSFAAGQIATFATVPTSPSFLEMYFDTAPNANDVTGSGFSNGRLILKGTSVSDSSGIFIVTSLTPVNLDQHTANDYVGQFSVTGQGSQGTLAFDSLVTDPTFFLSPLATFGFNFENISQGLPFLSVDPSDCYTPSSSGIAVGSSTVGARPCAPIHVNGLMSANSPDPNGGLVPNIGTVNGSFGAASGADFIAQTDFNSTISAAVPEPATLSLFTIGLLGLGVLRRFRKS